jgi:hypothetical protein
MMKPTPQKIEEAQVVSKADEPSDLPPADWTGELKAHLEKIQTRTQRPLPNGEESLLTPRRIIVELAVPPIEILKPKLEKPLAFDSFAMYDLKSVRWKSDFQPNLVRREMVGRINDILASGQPSWKMLELWQKVCEEYPVTMQKSHRTEFLKILRARQTTEWIKLTGNMNRPRRQDPEIRRPTSA